MYLRGGQRALILSSSTHTDPRLHERERRIDEVTETEGTFDRARATSRRRRPLRPVGLWRLGACVAAARMGGMGDPVSAHAPLPNLAAALIGGAAGVGVRRARHKPAASRDGVAAGELSRDARRPETNRAAAATAASELLAPLLGGGGGERVATPPQRFPSDWAASLTSAFVSFAAAVLCPLFAEDSDTAKFRAEMLALYT